MFGQQVIGIAMNDDAALVDQCDPVAEIFRFA